MKAMIAYFNWLSAGLPRNAKVEGAGIGKVDNSLAPDPVHGKELYEAKCAECHGTNGDGLKDAREQNQNQDVKHLPGEQLALAFGCFLVAGADAADDQPCGDLLAFLLRRERRVLDLGDLGVGDPAGQLVVPDGLRLGDRGPGILGDTADRRLDAGVHRHGDGEIGLLAADCP